MLLSAVIQPSPQQTPQTSRQVLSGRDVRRPDQTALDEEQLGNSTSSHALDMHGNCWEVVCFHIQSDNKPYPGIIEDGETDA